MTREGEKEGEGERLRDRIRERENIDDGVITKHKIVSLLNFI